jgi:hypothetical protein
MGGNSSNVRETFEYTLQKYCILNNISLIYDVKPKQYHFREEMGIGKTTAGYIIDLLESMIEKVKTSLITNISSTSTSTSSTSALSSSVSSTSTLSPSKIFIYITWGQIQSEKVIYFYFNDIQCDERTHKKFYDMYVQFNKSHRHKD